MSGSSASNSSRVSSGHASVADYLSDFQQQVEAMLPEENPGEPAMSQLVNIYVARDNKRRIVVMIQTGPTTLTRVNYVMPVSREGAPLFNLRGLQPHTPPTFSTMAISPLQTAATAAATWAAANNVAEWASEIARVAAAEAAAPEANRRRKRLMRNVLVYWRSMRADVQNALAGILARASVTTSRSQTSNTIRSVAPSSNSDPARRRSSSAARSATRRRLVSKQRISSRRRSNRRTTSNRTRRRISSNPT